MLTDDLQAVIDVLEQIAWRAKWDADSLPVATNILPLAIWRERKRYSYWFRAIQLRSYANYLRTSGSPEGVARVLTWALPYLWPGFMQLPLPTLSAMTNLSLARAWSDYRTARRLREKFQAA